MTYYIIYAEGHAIEDSASECGGWSYRIVRGDRDDTGNIPHVTAKTGTFEKQMMNISDYMQY